MFWRCVPERSGAEREYKHGAALSHTPGRIGPKPAADGTDYSQQASDDDDAAPASLLLTGVIPDGLDVVAIRVVYKRGIVTG